MAESPAPTWKESVIGSPEAERLREEVREYLQARARQAVAGLGTKLGDSVGRLGEGGAGTLTGPLAAGGKALQKGKPPTQALSSAGATHVKDVVKEKIKGLFGKGGKSGGGKSKSVTIVEDIDVGVPVREAYNQWTQFQEFSTFAKGAVSVDQADDTTSNWKVKVAKSTRSWRANVTEQIPDERISWTTEGAKGSVKGVVTFHPITQNLTRVLLCLEYFPHGLFEKTGNIWRAQGRRARLDLKLYRKFIMMRGEATDGWRGEIRSGQVVVDHEQAVEEEERDRRDTEGRDDNTPYDTDEDGQGYEDEEAEDADDLPEDELPDEDAAQDEELPEEDLADDGAGEEDFGEEAPAGGEAPEDVGDDETEPADEEPESAEDDEEAKPRRRSRRRPATAGR